MAEEAAARHVVALAEVARVAQAEAAMLDTLQTGLLVSPILAVEVAERRKMRVVHLAAAQAAQASSSFAIGGPHDGRVLLCQGRRRRRHASDRL